MAEDQEPQPEPEQSTPQPEQPSESPPGGPPAAGRSNVMWIAIGGGAALVVLVVVVVAVLLMSRGGSEPENTAQYFPRDAVAYTWFTLNPGDGQRDQMADLWERFSEFSEFQDGLEEMLEDMEDESGINFEDDVWPWIGPEVSLAVLDLGGFDLIGVAGIIGVRDHNAASDFLEDFLDYLEDEEVADFDDDTVGDFDTWVGEDLDVAAYALSKDWFVFATTENDLEDILDLISGDGGRPLAEEETFQQARAAMAGRRFASVYVDMESIMDSMGQLSNMGLAPGLGTAGMLGNPDWFALTAQWVDRGIVVETVSPTEFESMANLKEIGEPAKLLPDDTLGFLAMSFDPSIENWRGELDDYQLANLGFFGEMAVDEIADSLWDLGMGDVDLDSDDTFADILDLAIELVDDATGIDLEKDFFDYLGGRFIASVREFDFQRVEDADEYAVDAVAMLSYLSDNEEDLRDTMEEVRDLIETVGVDIDSEDVGAVEDAVVFDLEDLMGDTAYSPGYVMHKDYLTIGTTEDALTAIIESQNGDIETLSGVSEYQRVIGHLPDGVQGIFFVNLQTIVAQVGPDDMDMERDMFEVLEESLGAVAVGLIAGEDVSRATYAVTFFPE